MVECGFTLKRVRDMTKTYNDIKNLLIFCQSWKVWLFQISCLHFVQNIITPLKVFTEELCVITEQCKNSETKFAENVAGCFKNDKRNLANFSQVVESLKIWNFMSSYFKKYTFLELEIYRGVMFHHTEEPYKIWRE